MLTKETVLKMVTEERERQDVKWGYPQINTPFEWVSILGEEYGKFSKAVNDAFIGKTPDGNCEEVLRYAVQVASVAVAIVEHYGNSPMCGRKLGEE